MNLSRPSQDGIILESVGAGDQAAHVVRSHAVAAEIDPQLGIRVDPVGEDGIADVQARIVRIEDIHARSSIVDDDISGTCRGSADRVVRRRREGVARDSDAIAAVAEWAMSQ